MPKKKKKKREQYRKEKTCRTKKAGRHEPKGEEGKPASQKRACKQQAREIKERKKRALLITDRIHS